MSRVSCITVTYGPAPTLSRAVEALVRHSGEVSQDIIVVTQPDDEGRREDVSHLLDRVRHIELNENVGFGPANNLAVADCDTEFVAFVNPDLVVTEGWLNPLLEALGDPMVAIAAPPLLDGDGYLTEAGQAIFSDGGTEAMGGERWLGGYDSVMFDRDVDYASAACWLMRRDTFSALGGFDARYAPAYFEDSDLAMTAWSRGLVTRLVVDRPVVHHHEGASASRVKLAEASRGKFVDKWSRELAAQPSRRDVGEDSRAVRDHRAPRRIAHVFEGGTDSIQMERAAETAAKEAADNPRDRVTLVLPRGTTVGRLRRLHRFSGLEIVDVEAVRRVDVSWATEVRTVGR
jgi:GT2 family glycosyltransferase